LKDYHTYIYSVAGLNDCGIGETSKEVSYTVPGMPLQMKPPVTVIKACAVRITWNKPYDGGVPLLKYSV